MLGWKMNSPTCIVVAAATMVIAAHGSTNEVSTSVAVIPHVIELSIVSNETVRARSDNWHLNHYLPNGGVFLKHIGLQMETNIIIQVGEGFGWPAFRGGEIYMLLKIERGILFFDYSGGYPMTSKRISVHPYMLDANTNTNAQQSGRANSPQPPAGARGSP